MNERQIQYALTVAQTKSFSLAAEKLKISQPSLSKQILALEEKLGVKLFDRRTVPMTVTAAGEYFLQRAQSLMYQGDQLVRSMEGFRTGEKGRLTIGLSPFRNLYLMPRIIQAFKTRYPDVQITLKEAPSDQLRREAAEGSFDFAIVNLPVDEAMLDVILLEKEHLVVAVPNNLLHLIHQPAQENTRELDFSCFRELPFVVVAKSQEMRRYFDALCANCDITPNISVEVAGGVTSALSMARGGLGATLLPLQFISSEAFDENMTLFTVKNYPITRQPVVVVRKGQYISEYARFAISLLTRNELK